MIYIQIFNIMMLRARFTPTCTALAENKANCLSMYCRTADLPRMAHSITSVAARVPISLQASWSIDDVKKILQKW